MFRHLPLSVLLLALFLTSCRNSTVSPVVEVSTWSADSAWYQAQDTVEGDAIDVFYIVSTEVVSAVTPSGETTYRAQLTADDRLAYTREFAYVESHYCQTDLRCIAPYYHQFTFEAIDHAGEQFGAVYQEVVDEVCEAFDYYMRHQNQGRPFALVGFSQGALLTLDLLRHMTEEQYQQMVAAYAIGFRISAEDMKHPHIRPAVDETERGVTISYNSVLTPEAIWPDVAAGAATCINPVNWRTDSTPATFTYHDQLHTVYVDSLTQQLIVEVADPSEYRAWNQNPVFQGAGISPDCLHHFDLLFYSDYIHDNILKRAQIETGRQ